MPAADGAPGAVDASAAPPPPKPPPHRSGAALQQYVSEPASTLTMMRTYAEELLQQQQAAGSVHGEGGVGLSASAAAGPLARPPHFQLGPTVGTPRRRPGDEASSPSFRKLRSSIGWHTGAGGCGEGVVFEHRVAGDLIMPAETLRAAGAAGGTGTQAATRDVALLRRRPAPRSAAGAPAAGGAHGAAGLPCEGGAAAPAAGSPAKRAADSGSDDGKDDDLGSLDWEERRKRWWRRKAFWRVAGPLAASLALALAGTLYLVLGGDQRLGQFQMWRLCFFLAGLPVIWWIGRGCMDLAVWGVERTMFTWQNALYYAYAVRRPMAHVIRAALATGWWALIMTALSGDMNSTLVAWYNNVLKVFGCLTLFMTANLLKVLFAKMMASKFNQAAHYAKMTATLKREYLLQLMLQPRQRYSEFEELVGGEGCEGCDDTMARAKSAPADERPTPSKQSTLARLFQRGRSQPQPRKTRSRLPSIVMFWRGSQQELLPIEEEEVGEAAAGGGLPHGAVAVDIGAPRQAPAGQEMPLLRHTDVAAPPAADGGGGYSAPPSPARPPPSPARPPPSPARPPPSPPSKLARHRCDALEAAGGAATPRLARGLSGESEATPRRGRPAAHDCGSREASVAGGRGGGHAARAPPQRAASVASLRSAAPGGGGGGGGAPVELLRSASSSSSAGSQRLQMALRMSKMERYIRKHALEVTFKDALSRTERSEPVTTEVEARRLGFYVFHNLKADFERDHVVLADLEEFLSEGDAKAAWDMLDEDGDGRVSVQECCSAIARVFVDRRNLAASLKDARTIVGTLQSLIGVFLHILFAFFYLLIWDVDVMKTWAGFASFFLGLSFIFGNSIRTTYENVVFLFLVHPYDVGDAILVDSEQYKIEAIHLSFTVLQNGSGQQVFFPNEKLRLAPFSNLTNSGCRGESLKLLADVGTPLAAVDALRAAAEAAARAQPKEFTGAVSAGLSAAANPMKVTLSVWWEYSHSGADAGRLGRARTAMYAAVAEALVAQRVRYSWPAAPDAPGAAAAGAAPDLPPVDPASKLL